MAGKGVCVRGISGKYQQVFNFFNGFLLIALAINWRGKNAVSRKVNKRKNLMGYG